MKNYFFLKNYLTSEGAVSHNVLYYQQFSITHYQVSFYANNVFEQVPIVSTAFKEQQISDICKRLTQKQVYLLGCHNSYQL